MNAIALDRDFTPTLAPIGWTLTPRACSVPASQTSVAYLDGEHGEPVIFLHASASSGGQWRKIAETLDARYRPVLIDLYGYGATPQWRHRRPMLLAATRRGWCKPCSIA